MRRRPPRATRTYTRFPDTTLFRSAPGFSSPSSSPSHARRRRKSSEGALDPSVCIRQSFAARGPGTSRPLRPPARIARIGGNGANRVAPSTMVRPRPGRFGRPLTDVELRRYLSILRSRAWFIVATVVLAAAAGYVVSDTESEYVAQTTIYVGARSIAAAPVQIGRA